MAAMAMHPNAPALLEWLLEWPLVHTGMAIGMAIDAVLEWLLEWPLVHTGMVIGAVLEWLLEWPLVHTECVGVLLESFTAWPLEDRAPRMHWMAERSRLNEIEHHSQYMVVLARTFS